MVDEPQNGSPAAAAGIEAGDIITAVNGDAGQGFARPCQEDQCHGARHVDQARHFSQGRTGI